MTGLIYCITNASNGKKYVGQTQRTLAQRWSKHKYFASMGSTYLFHTAIRKHGERSFIIEQLDTGSSTEDLNKKEVFYIAALNTVAPNGYNLTLGGDHFELSAEAKRKISISLLGIRRSEETRDKMSKSRKARSPIKRKQCCKNGHILDEVNTYVQPKNGARSCLACRYLTKNQKLPKRLLKYVRPEV